MNHLNGHANADFGFRVVSNNGTVWNGRRTNLDRVLNATSLSRQQQLNETLFDPRRDLEDECGYPRLNEAISVEMYRELYQRDSIANRVVSVLPKECWQVSPKVYEKEEADEQTPFEEAWEELGQTLNASGASWHCREEGSPVWEYLCRLDVLSGVGKFGVLLLGIDDGKNLMDPVDGVRIVTNRRVTRRVTDRGVTVNVKNKWEPVEVPDGWMTENQEAALLADGAFDRKYRDPRTGEERTIKGIPLSNEERACINVWAKQRERAKELVATFNATRRNANGPGLRRSASGPDGRGRGFSNDPNEPSFQPMRKPDGSALFGTSPADQIANPLAQMPASSGGVNGPAPTGRYGPNQNPTQDVTMPPGNMPPSIFGTQTGWPAVAGSEQQQDNAPGGGYAPSGGTPTGGGNNPYATGSTDAQYGSLGMPPAALAGTDQQYFGVQYGPSEELDDEPPPSNQYKLLFLRPFDESLVQVVRWEWNIRNPRFAQPVMYRVTLNDPRLQHSGIGLPMATVFVHWSRLIHVCDNNLNVGSSEVFATPRMEPVLNNLLGLRKLYAAGPEGYWKSCFNILKFSTHPQLGGDVEVDVASLQDAVEQLENGLQRTLLGKGGDWAAIAPSVVDPGPFIDKQIEAVCIQLGCPVRVFKGSERGELASNQDDASWNDRLRHRQQNYLTPRVIVPFIDRLIGLGVLPEPGKGDNSDTEDEDGQTQNAANTADGDDETGAEDSQAQGSGQKDQGQDQQDKQSDSARADEEPEGYTVEWPDLDSLTDKDKAQVALQVTQALSAYVSGGVENLVSPEDYLVHFLKMDEQEANAVVDKTRDAHAAEDTLTTPPLIAGQPAAPAKGTAADQQQQQQADQFDQQQKTQQQAIKAGVAPGMGGGPPGAAGGAPPGKPGMGIASSKPTQGATPKPGGAKPFGGGK